MSEYTPTEYVVDFGDCRSSQFVRLSMALIEQNGAKLHERIVRCKDCKHYDAYNSRCNKFGIDCYLAIPQVNEKPGYEHTYGDYGYCAWGERREQ